MAARTFTLADQANFCPTWTSAERPPPSQSASASATESTDSSSPPSMTSMSAAESIPAKVCHRWQSNATAAAGDRLGTAVLPRPARGEAGRAPHTVSKRETRNIPHLRGISGPRTRASGRPLPVLRRDTLRPSLWSIPAASAGAFGLHPRASEVQSVAEGGGEQGGQRGSPPLHCWLLPLLRRRQHGLLSRTAAALSASGRRRDGGFERASRRRRWRTLAGPESILRLKGNQ